MILDRIAIDFLDWLRTLFWTGHTKQPHSPIPKVIEYQTGPNGLIQHVERSTQRAISTWAFTPKKRQTPSHLQRKYYLCLDLLNKQERGINSHRITVWATSVWMQFSDNEGFDADQLYTGLYDLSGPGGRANWWGAAVLGDLAKMVLLRGIDYFDAELTWENEIRLSISKVLGRHPERQR